MFEVTQTNPDHSETVLAQFGRYGSAIRYARGLLNAGERGVFVRQAADEPEPTAAALAISRAAQAKAREHIEYADPYGYESGRY